MDDRLNCTLYPRQNIFRFSFQSLPLLETRLDLMSAAPVHVFPQSIALNLSRPPETPALQPCSRPINIPHASHIIALQRICSNDNAIAYLVYAVKPASAD